MPIFISYSHADSEFVESLAKQLVRHKHYIWLDKWELNVGDSLIQRIQGALHLTPGLIVVLSKASVESEWCKKELEGGLIRELEEKRVVVFPVVKEDCELPLFLRGKVYADFRKSFDEGFRFLNEGIAKISNPSQGRAERPDFHTDWAVDWGARNGIGWMRMVLLDHSPQFPYSCYTEVRFAFDKPSSDWFVDQLRADRAELAQLHVMGALVKKLKELGDFRILIPDQFVQSRTLECTSESPSIQTLVEIDTRRLGEDTGRDVLFDAGNQIIKIYEGWQKIVQRPESAA
jgi:hypothetical protein